jgi:hypothetical protein
MTKINHLAIWLLVLAQQIIGGLWYSPWLFGDLWFELRGMVREDVNQLDPVPFIVSIIQAVAMTYFIAWLFVRLRIWQLRDALTLAATLWIAMSFLGHATNYTFLGLSWGVLLIDSGMALINIVLVCWILTLWKKA